jgi:hypothetical protein
MKSKVKAENEMMAEYRNERRIIEAGRRMKL